MIDVSDLLWPEEPEPRRKPQHEPNAPLRRWPAELPRDDDWWTVKDPLWRWLDGDDIGGPMPRVTQKLLDARDGGVAHMAYTTGSTWACAFGIHRDRTFQAGRWNWVPHFYMGESRNRPNFKYCTRCGRPKRIKWFP